MILIDAHCHLEPHDYPVIDDVIARARAQGLVHSIIVGLMQTREAATADAATRPAASAAAGAAGRPSGASAQSAERPSSEVPRSGSAEPPSHDSGRAAPRSHDFGHALALARAHPDFLSPTIGIHPHDAAKASRGDWDTLERLAALPAVVAIGEAGLDYFYDHSPREVQAEALRRQAQLARRLNKPLVVHVRDAHDECAAILEAEGVRDGQIHCFTGDTAAARRYLDLGLHLSISGVVTYKKSEALQQAVRFAPLDRLLVETDSPYLAPLPWRGKKNEPAYVAETAKKVAELQGRPADEVALACARNTARLFRLELRPPLP